MFGLSFLNSILLFGLLAGVIPVLIHLFVKHQPKIVYFSSLRFLKQIQKNKARIIKLRQILLLITRILIILFLILALARPVAKTLLPSANWRTHAPTVVVIIIDNSFSMNYLDGNNTLLERAKEIATDITDMLNNKDKLMLLTLNNNYNNQNSYFSKPSSIKERIDKISITDNAQLIKSVLLKADKELSRVDVINKEIYFITDNQKYTWKNILEQSFGQKASEQLQTDIFAIPVNQELSKSNIATISARYIPKLLNISNRSEIRAKIKNLSDEKINTVIVSLILNNITRAEKALSLNPYQTKQVSFNIQEKDEKLHFGKVEVKDKILPDDNSFYFNFSEVDLPKIAVISEANPSIQLKTVLDIITENRWQKTTPETITEEIVINNQLFILYRLRDFSEKLEFFIEEILSNDKSIFLVPGAELAGNDNLKIWLSNQKIYFGNIKTESSKINFINKLHPICAVFSDEMFQNTRINKMWLISTSEFSPLLSADDNPVFLIKEKFLISAIDFEESWSNFIYQSAFPVFFYNIGQFLGEKESKLFNYITGTPFPIKAIGSFECHLPDGYIIPIVTGNDTEKFTQTDKQGHYFIYKDNTIENIYSYNVTRDESELTLISTSDIEQLQEYIPKIHFLKSDDWDRFILTSRYGYEFWKILLWIVLALLVIEMVLAYSGKKGYKGNREIRGIRK